MKKKPKPTLLISPTEGFLNWLKKTYPGRAVVKPEGYTDDNTVSYTLPDIRDEDEFGGWLKQNYRVILKNELIAWHVDHKNWPQIPDMEQLRMWFDLRFVEAQK